MNVLNWLWDLISNVSINDLLMIWASCLLLSGLYLQRVRLVPFVVLVAIAFVHYIEMRGAGHYLQQLAASFMILSAMFFAKSPTPQKEFITCDILLNLIAFLAYLTAMTFYPTIQRLTTPLITIVTGLILLAVTKQQKDLLMARLRERYRKKAERWCAKEIHDGR